jgi:hypothetical protein
MIDKRTAAGVYPAEENLMVIISAISGAAALSLGARIRHTQAHQLILRAAEASLVVQELQKFILLGYKNH